MTKLLDIVTSLAEYSEELTIYAQQPWSCESLAVVAREPDAGGVPPEAAALAAAYFIEVSVANEVLSGWRENQRRNPSVQDDCERLIHYAVHDA
jgi:hypothetical protein